MIRWTAESLRYNQDNEVLQNVIIYPAGIKKEQVKQEHRHHKRHLLVKEGESFELIR